MKYMCLYTFPPLISSAAVLLECDPTEMHVAIWPTIQKNDLFYFVMLYKKLTTNTFPQNDYEEVCIGGGRNYLEAILNMREGLERAERKYRTTEEQNKKLKKFEGDRESKHWEAYWKAQEGRQAETSQPAGGSGKAAM